ncbi:hypothetical protein A3F29_02280 [Candidatus Roizmanbacteria bacterium RIFCSPHIGHO2_12_FULL_33_9]|uniref:Metallo-beta-lactamase domain-containing protein n=1 Tax=Candidatus Roizmanbacteria bacterium RIFCSPHIGHO2_12_FULL_33_9 TaxID=1802045 RepID=A0A1F7HIP5_9BACT|nr:MAG: hypothetical protein A3F29_02280 [Candidatus Roizmanbacteria bacterium RIFCSPHIGHO2_12_FULL_33_9]
MNGIKLLNYKVGALQTNCYILSKGSNALIFDAGDSAEFILEKILELKLKPLAIFATHGHFDHVMAVGEIQLSFDIPFYISKEDLFLLDRAGETAEFFLKKKFPIIAPKNIKDLKDGKLKVGLFTFEVIRTPGHTPGSTCFKFKDFVLTGDTLFKSAVGRYDFSYSNKKDLIQSINRLYKFSGDTVVYPGHEDATTIGQEKKNPIL